MFRNTSCIFSASARGARLFIPLPAKFALMYIPFKRVFFLDFTARGSTIKMDYC
jgi:hypothetical protein